VRKFSFYDIPDEPIPGELEELVTEIGDDLTLKVLHTCWQEHKQQWSGLKDQEAGEYSPEQTRVICWEKFPEEDRWGSTCQVLLTYNFGSPLACTGLASYGVNPSTGEIRLYMD
jgi:hypothetical protein